MSEQNVKGYWSLPPLTCGCRVATQELGEQAPYIAARIDFCNMHAAADTEVLRETAERIAILEAGLKEVQERLEEERELTAELQGEM